jgi:hypothetical protein
MKMHFAERTPIFYPIQYVPIGYLTQQFQGRRRDGGGLAGASYRASWIPGSGLPGLYSFRECGRVWLGTCARCNVIACGTPACAGVHQAKEKQKFVEFPAVMESVSRLIAQIGLAVAMAVLLAVAFMVTPPAPRKKKWKQCPHCKKWQEAK